jgi:hypothetical protein
MSFMACHCASGATAADLTERQHARPKAATVQQLEPAPCRATGGHAAVNEDSTARSKADDVSDSHQRSGARRPRTTRTLARRQRRVNEEIFSTSEGV